MSLKSISVIGVVSSLAVLLFVSACGPSREELARKKKTTEQAEKLARIDAYLESIKAPVIKDDEKFKASKDGLKFIDRKVGTGKKATLGCTVTIEFIGWVDGTKLDSSRERGGSYTFVLGKNAVIKGWDVGIEGMKEGGTRLLIIPPGLAYGKAGLPGFVGPDKTLTYRIKLLKVYPPLK